MLRTSVLDCHERFCVIMLRTMVLQCYDIWCYNATYVSVIMLRAWIFSLLSLFWRWGRFVQMSRFFSNIRVTPEFPTTPHCFHMSRFFQISTSFRNFRLPPIFCKCSAFFKCHFFSGIFTYPFFKIGPIVLSI